MGTGMFVLGKTVEMRTGMAKKYQVQQSRG